MVDIDLYLETVVQERQNGLNAVLFSGMEAQWKERCHSYEANGGDGTSIAVWPLAKTHGISLKNLYSKPQNGIQAGYLNNLRDRTLQMCPMCGEAGTPNTLDHYLPKDEYPDFAILPQNLVPACDICQGHKLTLFEEDGERLFLHPYYDQFLETQVVRLEVEPPYNTPVPSLSCHPNVGEEQIPLIGRHLKKMGLQPRFLKFFRYEYLRTLKLVQRARDKGLNVEQQIIAFRDHAADRSVNCWEHIFYEGITVDDDVMAFLTTGQLPANL
ncbi:hypothetical protein AB9E15_11580 [Rhizobium leguminosarum]|uniref:hypothetical protein n=1 Tax=Rhizobium leguminosarum TaxID=384 RepID=UPI003F9BFFDC